MSIRRRAMLATAGLAAAAGIATGLAPAATAATPATTLSPATAVTPTAQRRTCDAGPWGWRVQGRPTTFHAGARAGDYLWHDKYGFHLRVTHASKDRAVYSGEIISTAPMRKDAVKLEGRDTVALSANRKVLSFRFYNYGRIDGVNFHTDCAKSLTVKWLDRDGKKMRPSHVYLGYFSHHPRRIPFTVYRLEHA